MVKKILATFVLALLLLATILGVNTVRYSSSQVAVEATPAPAPEEAAIVHFQEAIRIRTISYGDSSKFDSTQFLRFRQFLFDSYPHFHATLSREIVAGYSLLYRWEGKDKTVNPVIFMAHQDVVPIEEETTHLWTANPFGGDRRDDFIWGRGTVDNKNNLVAIFESVEKLLAEGFQPARTIYFFFGHDEEVGGEGAKAAASLLTARKVVADMIMDEGGIITTDKLPGVSKPVALIGTSEKGYMSVDLTAQKSGGHSSQPEAETSIDILSKALIKIRANPFAADFPESTQGLLDHIGPEMSTGMKIIFANQWLFKPLIISQYEKIPGGNAMVRTTAVPTIIDAGIKDNVVPTIAKATVNYRLLPGDAAADVLERTKELIDDDRIKLGVAHNFISEASPVASEKSYGYQLVAQTIRKTMPNTITAPFLMIGGTDSRHFTEVSSSIIKFSPMVDPIGFHGIDERIKVSSFGAAIWFYRRAIMDL